MRDTKDKKLQRIGKNELLTGWPGRMAAASRATATSISRLGAEGCSLLDLPQEMKNWSF